MKQTLQTIDFAQRLGAPFVVMHLGAVPMQPITDSLIDLAQAGKLLSREFVRRKVKAVKKREAAAPRYLERVKDCMRRVADYAAAKNIRLGMEGRRGYEEIPSERELPALLDELNSPHRRLLARHRAYPDQRKSQVSRSRGVAGENRTARVWLPLAGLHLARAGSPTAIYRRRRSQETCSASAAELLYCLGNEPAQNGGGNSAAPS